MKILHVIRGLANSSGTTHIVGPLSEAQARLGHEVTVFFVEKRGQEAVTPDPRLVESCQFPMTLPSRHYGWSRRFQSLIRQRVRDFDVVHIHAIWNFPTWCAMREAGRAGVPYIVAPQGSLEHWALNRSPLLKRVYASLFEKRWFDRAARMQALTRTEANQCREFGITVDAALLPNGVDLEVIDRVNEAVDLRAELGLPPQERLLLFLGRVFPKKGLDLLIAAFGALANQRSDVTLLIAGHDAGTGFGDEVLRQLNRVGATHKTRWLGEVSGQRKFEVLRAADLFVLASRSEGLPVAVLEAMGAGLPVVITPACNLPEVVQAKAGWLAEPNQTALYQVVSKALQDTDELAQRGGNARRLVEKEFTWTRIAAQSITIYRDMLRSPNVERNRELASAGT